MYNKEGKKGNKGFKNRNENEGYKPFKDQFKKLNDEKRNAVIESQSKNLGIIKLVVEYLDKFVQNEEITTPLKIADINSYLNDELKLPIDETKYISRYNYLLLDLANAYKNKYITNDADRIIVRKAYIKEIFRTAFKPVLHSEINDMIEKNNNLFCDNFTAANDR